jgi:uncharacterized membrane protein (DUF4010 family)
VVNPYKIWLMVVLISALNFSSYLFIKIVGPEHGVGLAGLLGGLASSTAVTLGFSQRSRQPGEDASALALGIVLAWTVMFFRVAIMTALISWELGRQIALPIGLLCVSSLGACYWLWRRNKHRERGEVKPGSNPFELDEAIKFGLLFGVILVISKAAQVYLGDAGLAETLAIECAGRLSQGAEICARQSLEAVQVPIGGGPTRLPLARLVPPGQLRDLEELLEPLCG